MAPAQKGGLKIRPPARSRGGLTTKIEALVDSQGNLARFVRLPRQRHDSVGVARLIEGIEIAAVIGDKAFDNGAPAFPARALRQVQYAGLAKYCSRLPESTPPRR
jgi:hypothetical protein